jgi:hypothetical protein
MRHRVAASAVLMALIITLSACGGGGGGEPTSRPPSNTPQSVVLSMTPPQNNLPPATKGLPYNFGTFSATGGTPPYTYTVSGNLPPGLSFVASQINAFVEGTPTTAGSFNFTVNAADSRTGHGSQSYTIVVDEQFLLLTQDLPWAKLGASYDQALHFINGTSPITWSIGIGQLPQGLSLDPVTGHIHGTPTGNGSNFEVVGTDSSPQPATVRRVLGIVVVGPFIFNSPSTFDLHRDTMAFQIIGTRGGVSPVTVSLVSGTIPPGMTFLGYFLEGRPTQVGTYNFTVQAQDSYVSGPETITQVFTANVLEKAPSFTARAIPPGVVGRPYDFVLAVDGGLHPLTFASDLAAPGLSLDPASGRLSGTPTTAGTFDFTATVTDSENPPSTGAQPFRLSITTQSLGRNDSIATATPISNVQLEASLSPFDAAGTAAPDTDYYVATANGGAIVQISVFAPTSSPMDPILEIVDSNGHRLTTCRNIGSDDGVTGAADPTPDAFDDVCLNDDVILGVVLGSELTLQIPPGGPQTFYIHVSNFRGDARPDMVYSLFVSGVN